jgi:hypothetical protein
MIADGEKIACQANKNAQTLSSNIPSWIKELHRTFARKIK